MDDRTWWSLHGFPGSERSITRLTTVLSRGRLHNVSTTQEQPREIERWYEHDARTAKLLLMKDL